jgi:hypothetical protein
MESLSDNDVYRLKQGRVLGEDTGGAVKDVILVGLQNLTEGEKTPLTEYNEAFQRLQRRRRIVSVAEQAQSLKPLPDPITATASSSTSVPLREDPAVPVGEYLQDYENMSVENEEEEGPTEIEQILDELADGRVQEPTLLRLSEEDVALDMDEVVVDALEEESSDSDEDSEASGGLGEDD